MMIPPYTGTKSITRLVAKIMDRLLVMADKGFSGDRLPPELRKINRLKTIHASLAVENNTLSLAQVTALFAGKRVVGPREDIQAVQNAFAAYDKLSAWQPQRLEDLLAAHKLLMHGLVDEPGRLRTCDVGVFKGNVVVHMGPPAQLVYGQLSDLLDWLDKTDEHPLVKSCIFHYEFEFIHPFVDGNGRMGRLWQTLILGRWRSLFFSLPVETVIHGRQEEYYLSLKRAGAQGESTVFIEYMLEAILQAMVELEERVACVSRKQGSAGHDQVVDRQSDQVRPQGMDQAGATGCVQTDKSDQVHTDQADQGDQGDQGEHADQTDQVAVLAQKSDHAASRTVPAPRVMRLLAALISGERSLVELMDTLGARHAPTFRKNCLDPALTACLVERTRPQAPRSPAQKYRLTEKGRRLLDKMPPAAG